MSVRVDSVRIHVGPVTRIEAGELIFDCGPGAAALAICSHAAPGPIHYPLLDALLADPFLAQKPPKAALPGLFGAADVSARLADFSGLEEGSLRATCTEWLARCVRSAVAYCAPDPAELSVSGSVSDLLLARLQLLLPNTRVTRVMPDAASDREG